ncbi:MAG TPA: hypothetical protein VFX51_11585 [Solirubrobacteraceae bacterium]|nr:hypothetical protein [Solirubrobacteraceae bacterium]
MRRRQKYIVIGFLVFMFLAISALLARGLTGAGTERSKVLALLEAQARGDADAVLAALPACHAQPACAQVTRERVAELRRPGDVQILTYSPSVRVALTRQTGTGRVAWRAGSSLPVVQCVRVRRDGPLTGGDVELLSISAPIGGEQSCPG